MTLWMIWGLTVTVLLGVAASLAERVLIARRRQTRWAWLGAWGASLALLAWSWLRPLAATPEIEAAAAVWSGAAPPVPQAEGAAWLTSILPVLLARLGDAAVALDPVVARIWPVATALTLIALAGGLFRIRRASRQWRPARVEADDVMVAPDFGPAVVGVLNPTVVLPAWSLYLDRERLRIVWLHEAEHRAARDTLVLFAVMLGVAIAPWNAGLWWIAKRARQAIEIDCDRRVLASGVSRDRYGSLLLELASRTRPSPILATAFGRPISLLERRLTVMSTPIPARRTVCALGMLATAATLAVAACEAPAPMDVTPAATPAGGSPSHIALRAYQGEVATGLPVRDGGPLVFVDGVETERTLEELADLAIERIEVLKNHAATQYYGVRGAGGVILVFTTNASAAAPSVDEGGTGRAIVPLSGEIPDDVEVFIDGARYTGSLADLHPDSVDRIEVMHEGPTRRVYITLK